MEAVVAMPDSDKCDRHFPPVLLSTPKASGGRR
jgi:hypothetical protein